MTEGEFGCNIKGGEHLPSVGQNWALFLDFDGTLVDLAPTPGAVCLSPAVRFSTLRSVSYTHLTLPTTLQV